jgi:hypothetical protein
MKQLHFFDNSNTSISSIKQQFDFLLKNPSATTLIKISFLLIGLMWILLGIFYKALPPTLPLLFSKPWGEGQLIAKPYLTLVPISTTILFIINSRLASLSIAKDKLLAHIFLIAQAVISFMSITTLIRLIILLA